MRLLILAAATILTTGIGAAPVAAQGYHGHPGWHGHRHRVCRVYWNHHHRVRRCWWR